jgi:hypothetical protein
MGQIGASVVNPAAPVRGAVAAGKATGKAAKELMRDFQAYNRELAAPGASYAVKPKGGVSAYTGQSRTNLDDVIDQYMDTVTALDIAPEKMIAIRNFIQTKAPKYFSNTYGTAEDPLRTAIRERRIEPVGRESSKMPPYMVDAARDPNARGRTQAAIDLERAYDDLTGIKGLVYAAPGMPRTTEYVRRQQISEALGREGVPVEARNPPTVDTYGPEEFAAYPTSTQAVRALAENESSLPPHLQQALRTGEMIYDVKPRFEMLSPPNVIEALNAVSPDKLKNMSFPEALIQGLQATAPVRDYLAAIDLAEKGAAVPPAALMKFTQPVLDTSAGKWVKLTDPLATRMEGKLMKHSVGGYSEGTSYGTGYTGLPYGGKKAFDEGLVEVYSLRGKDGKPLVTVEVANKGTPKEPKLAVTQIRGRFNSMPPLEAELPVLELLNTLDEGGKLKEIKPNSYSISPTGDRMDQGTQVNWGRLYDEWKSDSQQ